MYHCDQYLPKLTPCGSRHLQWEWIPHLVTSATLPERLVYRPVYWLVVPTARLLGSLQYTLQASTPDNMLLISTCGNAQ